MAKSSDVWKETGQPALWVWTNWKHVNSGNVCYKSAQNPLSSLVISNNTNIRIHRHIIWRDVTLPPQTRHVMQRIAAIPYRRFGTSNRSLLRFVTDVSRLPIGRTLNRHSMCDRQVVPKRRQYITTMRCVITQKSEDLNYEFASRFIRVWNLVPLIKGWT